MLPFYKMQAKENEWLYCTAQKAHFQKTKYQIWLLLKHSDTYRDTSLISIGIKNIAKIFCPHKLS